MQQAYRVLRVVAEAQTIRIVLMLTPNEIMLSELCTACSALNSEDSRGVKAVVLDFKSMAAAAQQEHEGVSADVLQQAWQAVRAVETPVLAVVRGNLSVSAAALVRAADLTLVADDAVLPVQELTSSESYNGQDSHSAVHETLTGAQALRLGLLNWSVPAQRIDAEMERILDMLREQSAISLRLVKASVRQKSQQQTLPHQEEASARLETLKRINEFYIAQVMQTADAGEGLHAFLEKRKPQWKNR